jgi:DNA adenine methylase
VSKGIPETGSRRYRESPDGEPIEPFLRWAGGKRQIVRALSKYLPSDIAKRTYHEPFAGGGCVFFQLRPRKAWLSDANEHLISCYSYVRDKPKAVARYLEEHRTLTSEKYYYKIRDKYNSGRPSAAQAARFIYLNKTCFNGIFRVNTHGAFNVPYGWKEPPAIPTYEEIQRASDALGAATLSAAPFQKSIARVKADDFVYFDPPYPPLNGTAYFTHYTAERFGTSDQQALAKLVMALHKRGCLFMMSNADTPVIRSLYRSFQITELDVIRYITCKDKKHRVSEVVITNYSVKNK